jgi:Tfp pilus assembly protein PilX
MVNVMNKFTKSQSGAVLIISLIILLALTIIGITSSNVTSLEEKMAANIKDINLAFQAAESTLREVELNVLKNKPTFDRTLADAAQGVDGVYTTLVNCKKSPPAPANDPYVCTSDKTTYPRDTLGSSPALDATKQPFYANVNWDSTTTTAPLSYAINIPSSTEKKLIGLYKPPEYILEEVMSQPPTNTCGSDSLEAGQTCQGTTLTDTWIRITAHGWGSNGNSVATVQSVVKVTYQNQ